MPDAEQLACISRGTKTWNEWRVENPTTTVDLSKAKLSGEYLASMNLSGVNLSGADLSEANLEYTDLSAADLKLANLNKARLGVAKLSGANLSAAALNEADLSGADLSAAVLNRAYLCGADLKWANLSGADLSGANFNRASFSGANLSGANLGEAYLWETGFADTNLRDARGLDACIHGAPSVIDYRTLSRSGTLPLVFLRGCGLPDVLIDYLPSLLNEAVIQFYSCFISYSHADKSFARRLHDMLQARGVRCWLDERQLLPGDDIYHEVDRAIRRWDKVLLCCSKDSLTSWWVDDEIGKAFEKEQHLMKERKKKILSLVPLNLDGHIFRWESGKASQVRQRLAADFTGWERDNAKFEGQVEKVILALRSEPRARRARRESPGRGWRSICELTEAASLRCGIQWLVRDVFRRACKAYIASSRASPSSMLSPAA